MKAAPLLIGRGSPAADTPRETARALKRLEGELDRGVRSGPRAARSDPYRQGLEASGAALAKRPPDSKPSHSFGIPQRIGGGS